MKNIGNIILSLFLFNFAHSMSFHSGPICKSTYLKKTINSENAIPLLIVNDTMLSDPSTSNYQYRDVDLSEVIYVAQVSDTTINQTVFEVKEKSALSLVKMKDGSWKPRGTYLKKDSTWIRAVFLTDELPKFCREQTPREINERKSSINNLFLGIILMPVVLLTVIFLV